VNTSNCANKTTTLAAANKVIKTCCQLCR